MPKIQTKMATTEMTARDRNDRDQTDQTSLPTQMTATKMTGHGKYYIEGVTYPENEREKYDAKTSYFELVPAKAFWGGVLCCWFLIPSCYNLRTYLYFSNFSTSITYSYPKYDCCICLKYVEEKRHCTTLNK